MPSERTLILIKPDAMERRLAGRLISRIEDKGLAIVGMKLLQVTPELSRQHYAEHVNKPFYPLVEKFIVGYRRGAAAYHEAFGKRDNGKLVPGPNYDEMIGILSNVLKQPPALVASRRPLLVSVIWSISRA